MILLSASRYRFYNPEQGRIMIDGQCIQNATFESLRHGIGVVPQETTLLNESIFYNIAYGKPGGTATREEVIQAAKLAKVHHTIMSMPQVAHITSCQIDASAGL